MFQILSPSWLRLVLAALLLMDQAHGFSSSSHRTGGGSTTTSFGTGRRVAFTAERPYAITIDAPTREDIETDRKTRRSRKTGGDDNDLGDDEENFEDALRRQGPLEYLEDDPNESREMEDPFHILLMGSTFDKPKITVSYVAGSLNYVLDMPFDEATELSQFSHDEGMSCLGTWPREQCLVLGRQLQVRDIVCRVVPYAEGGQRGWQAKDASAGTTNSNSFLN
jgi:hypothetical protein